MAEVRENKTFGTVNMLKYNISKNSEVSIYYKMETLIKCDVYVHLN